MADQEGAGSRQLRRGVSGRDRPGIGGKQRSGFYSAEEDVAAGCRIHRRKNQETLRCSGFFSMSTSHPELRNRCGAATETSPSLPLPIGKKETSSARKIRPAAGSRSSKVD